jgi:lipoprotein-releasing system permease protein
MKYEWFIASRYLRSRRKQSFISIISIISVGGVALGIATVILVISVLNGFGRGLREKFLANEAHLRVQSANGYFSDYEQEIAEIEKIKGVVAASPVIFGQVAVMSRDSETIEDTIYVKGIDTTQEDQVTGFKKFVPNFTGFQNSPILEQAQRQAEGRETITGGIILGYQVARRMGAFPGDIVRLVYKIIPDPVHYGSYVPHIRNFAVVGVYQSGIYHYDNAFGFIDLQTAQELFKRRNQINLIEVRAVEADMATPVMEQIRNQIRFNNGGMLGAPIVTTWMDSQAPLFNALELEKLITVIIEALIILVAAFNIASTLIMMVMEKTRDIGILRAIGASKQEVRRIFVFQGSIIGVLGAVIGTVLGVVVCWLLDWETVRPSEWFALLILAPVGIQIYLAFQRSAMKSANARKLVPLLWVVGAGLLLYCLVQPIRLDNLFGGDYSQVYQLDRLPVKINWFFVVFMNVLSLAICLLAAVYPARQAANLNPVEALRHE